MKRPFRWSSNNQDHFKKLRGCISIKIDNALKGPLWSGELARMSKPQPLKKEKMD